MNNVCLIGRLTKDPDLKYTQAGQAVAQFTIAVDNPFSKDKQADFIQCIVWAKAAENMAKYCQKGKMVSVVGRIQTRNYEGSDGRKVYVTEVVATDVRYLPDGKSQAPATDQGLMQGAKVSAFVDDLPFDN